jgi:hypothetical protein
VYSGIEIPADGNDGLAVLLALAAEYARASTVAAGDEFVQEFSQRALAVLSRVVGPFSFVLYDQRTQYLWYGRDAVGRRSLLTRTVFHGGCASFCAASVAPPQSLEAAADVHALDGGGEAEAANCSDESDSAQEQDMTATAASGDDSGWAEVAPHGMWRLQLEQYLQCSCAPHALLFPWIISPCPALPFAADNATMCADAVLCCLNSCVRARALLHSGSCGISILFSGGLDCMIIAALAARCVAQHSVIDLFNVAFDAAEAPDRESACAGRSPPFPPLRHRNLSAAPPRAAVVDLSNIHSQPHFIVQVLSSYAICSRLSAGVFSPAMSRNKVGDRRRAVVFTI